MPWIWFGIVSGCTRTSEGLDSAIEEQVGVFALECEAPTGPPSELHEHQGLRWHLVPLNSDRLESLWAIVILPSEGRSAYEEGLPVVVNVLVDTVLDTGYRVAPRPLLDPELGIIEVQALPPGWMQGEVETSGDSDYQGLDSQEAVRQAILWASGRTSSADGSTLSEVVGRTTCGSRLIVAATSSSGTTAVGALHPDRSDALEGMAGLELFETPTLPQFLAREAGVPFLDFDHQLDSDGNGWTWDDARNLSYRTGDCDLETCALDYSTLRWDSERSLAQIWPDHVGVNFPGVMYLDRNQNGMLDLGPEGNPDVDGSGALESSEDFVFMGQIEGQSGYRFSTELITVADAREVFGDAESWPTIVPSLVETRAWWGERRMGADLEVLARAWPTDALAGVNYTEIDHAIALAGRPHITTIVNTYLAANLPLRLNASPEIAQCLLVADSWSNWTPAPALSTPVDERDLDRWAWPETIPSSGVRTAGVVALLWEAFGPIRTCPQASSSRIP